MLSLDRFSELLKNHSRFTDWWFFKISYLFTPFYFLLLGFDTRPTSAISLFICLLGYFITTAAFGYFINDLGDRKSDRDSEKKNVSGELSLASILAAITALLLFSFGCLFISGASSAVYVLAACEISLFCIYSFQPFRFKESYFGLCVDSFYAHVIPFSIAALLSANKVSELPLGYSSLFVIAVLWQFVCGLRGIVNHELEDLPNDLASSTRTAVVRMGKERAQNMLKWGVNPLELVLLISLLGMTVSTVSLPLAGFVFYALWYLWDSSKKGQGFGITCYSDNQWNGFFDLFYRRVLPLLVVTATVLAEASYWPFIVLHFLLFNVRRLRKIPRSVIDCDVFEIDGKIRIVCKGCYLTSRLTERSDVSIELSFLANDKQVASGLIYGENEHSDFYTRKFGITESPVCFTAEIVVQQRDDRDNRAQISIQAAVLPTDEIITLLRKNIRIPESL